MKFLTNSIFTLAVCLFFLASASAQQPDAAQQPAPAPQPSTQQPAPAPQPASAHQAGAKKIYQNVEVEKFTIQPGVEYPADKVDGLTKSISDTLNRSNRFTQVSTSDGSTTSTTEPTEKLRISGEIIKYTKGSRAMRYMVGMGTGATKIIVNVKFTDVTSGEVVYQQVVDGDVTWGLFGGSGDDAKSGVADEIIKVMKKNGLAGEKIKK